MRHTVRPTNVVSRLTVSVAVDYIKILNKDNKIEYVPYDDVFSKKHEMNQNVVKLLDMLT